MSDAASESPAALPSRRYRVASLDALANDRALLVNGRPAVERAPWLPSAVLEVPPLTFGHTDFSSPHIDQNPWLGAAGGRQEHPAVAAYTLRNVVVHRKYGILTIEDRVVSETLAHLPLHAMPGAQREGEGLLRLPEFPRGATLPSAFHLLACNIDNYAHWLWDAASRYDTGWFHGMGVGPEAAGGPVLLTPPLDVVWKWQSLDLIVAPEIPRVALTAEANVLVQRLLYLPVLTSHFSHHRALLAVFDRMRAAAYAGLSPPDRPPWRRLYISRADSRNRVLVNEAEIEAHAVAAGFIPVRLSDLSVAEQVRLFAEASHIIAPHGAGLTNLSFCHAGTAVCELHMDAYVQWAMRCMAALRRLRYGCLLGQAVEPRAKVPHGNSWRLDPAALDAVLADPRFIGPG